MKINENDIIIKKLEENDNFNDLIKLSKDFFYDYETHNQEFFEIEEINELDIKNYFLKFIGKEDYVAYIALFNNKIIGYITFYINNQPNFYKAKKIGNISGLMINKNYRKNGIANKLVNLCKDYFQKNNIKYYTVFTSVNNKNGLKLYKKNGMEELYMTLYGKLM